MIYDLIKFPLFTEKSRLIENKYTFAVDKKAKKPDIKRAIEEIYKVNVEKINIIKVRGKKKRVRTQVGKTSSFKKAIVTLKKGEKIEFA